MQWCKHAEKCDVFPISTIHVSCWHETIELSLWKPSRTIDFWLMIFFLFYFSGTIYLLFCDFTFRSFVKQANDYSISSLQFESCPNEKPNPSNLIYNHNKLRNVAIKENIRMVRLTYFAASVCLHAAQRLACMCVR